MLCLKMKHSLLLFNTQSKTFTKPNFGKKILLNPKPKKFINSNKTDITFKIGLSLLKKKATLKRILRA